MMPTPKPGQTAKERQKSKQEAYQAEVKAIKDRTPGYERFELMGYAPDYKSSSQVVKSGSKKARPMGYTTGFHGVPPKFSEKKLQRDVKKYTAALDAKELQARQKEEIKSKGQEAKSQRIRAGVRNKSSRSLLAETERAGFLGPTGTLG